MSSHKIVSLFKAVDARNWAGLAEHFDRDVVYERPGYPPYQGVDALMHFYREVRVIATGEHQLEHIVFDGDHGACWGRFVGTHRDGSPIDVRFADTYAFRDGRIRARCSYFFQPSV